MTMPFTWIARRLNLGNRGYLARLLTGDLAAVRLANSPGWGNVKTL